MARKTVDVAVVKERANTFFLSSDDSMAGERRGMAMLLEAVLHPTGNYKGFRYLSTEWDEDAHALREDYDDTRRCYY